MSERCLSIIIPVYNAAAFLPRCLDSLVGQTYSNLEIICVNDGSTDGSAAILDEYAAKDARIKVIHQKNAGVSVARNAGLDVATGEFVTFVDADDWVEQDAYEKVLACFTEEFDVVCFGASVDGSCTDECKADLERLLDMRVKGELWVTGFAAAFLNACIWNKVWRRSVIEQSAVRFVEGMRYSEDECFFYCTLAGVRKLWLMQDKLYHYVQHPMSAMKNDKQLMYRVQDAINGVVFLLRHYKNAGVYEQMKGIFLVRFQQCYECAEAFASPDMKQWVQRVEYEILREGRLIQNLEKYYVREVMRRQSGGIAQLFCQYRDNRLCYGIGRFSMFSITYEEERRVYRLLGRIVRVRRRERV